jgi:HEAT repeat protein
MRLLIKKSLICLWIYILATIPGCFTNTLRNPTNASHEVYREQIASLLVGIDQLEYGFNEQAIQALLDFIPVCETDSACFDGLESELLSHLDTGLSRASLHLVCEILGQIGSEATVKKLAPMLTDSSVAEMALYALARIPGEQATRALRDALPVTCVPSGVIHELGSRIDTVSVIRIISIMGTSNVDVKEAAINTLGEIATTKAINHMLATYPPSPQLRAARGHALLNAAYQLRQRDPALAYTLFSEMWRNEPSNAVRLSALQGIIQCSPKTMAPIISALHDSDPQIQMSAIQFFREIEPQPDSLQQIWSDLNPIQQLQMLSAFCEREDTLILPMARLAILHDSLSVRLESIHVLGTLGNAQDAILLAQSAAAEKGKERGKVRDACRTALILLNHPNTDAAILSAIPTVAPAVQAELIHSAGQRLIMDNVDQIFKTAESPDRLVRLESYQTLSLIAGPDKLEKAIQLLMKAPSDADRNEALKTTAAISMKIPDPDRWPVMVTDFLAREEKSVIRASLLQVLGRIGHSASLSTIESALSDSSETVRLGAIRALTEWPDTRPLQALESAMDRNAGKKETVLTQRAYITLLSRSEPDSDTVAHYKKVMQLTNDIQTQHMILSGVSKVFNRDALLFVIPYLNSELQMEAETAFIQVAWSTYQDHSDLIRPVVENLRNTGLTENTRRSAGFILGRIQDL